MKKVLQAADYRILVEGELDPLWFDWLGMLKVTVQREPGQPVLTWLEGRLKDQATLQGVLDTLCMLGVCLVRVERLPCT